MDAIEPKRLSLAPKYQAWKDALARSGCRLRGVELLQDLPKRDGSLLFALLRVHGDDPEGNPLPAYALLRGHACVIVTEVLNRGTGEKKFLMVRQRRIAHGRDSLEFPAGMLDLETKDPAGVAVKELLEETGLEIRRDELIALTDRPLYSSPGLDDEAIHFFGCVLALPPEKFLALEGAQGGVAEEGETIRLELWEYPDVLREIDSLQTRMAFQLYFEHQRTITPNMRPEPKTNQPTPGE